MDCAPVGVIAVTALSVSPPSTTFFPARHSYFQLGGCDNHPQTNRGNQLPNVSIVMLLVTRRFCYGIEQHLLRTNVGQDEVWLPRFIQSQRWHGNMYPNNTCGFAMFVLQWEGIVSVDASTSGSFNVRAGQCEFYHPLQLGPNLTITNIP